MGIPGTRAENIRMIYFWLIPLLFLLVIALVLFRKGGTKRGLPGRSRLDEARNQ